MKKLIILGDSILKGVTFSSETGRYKLCIQKYDNLSNQGFEVRNYSKMGATIEYGERVLREELKENSEDCIVLLEYGGNDCNYQWKEISDKPQDEHTCCIQPKDFERKYKTCVEYARSKGAKVLISNLPPLDSDKYMNWISRGLSYEKILMWLGDTSMLYRWHENYNRLIERIADKLNILLIDVRGTFLTSHDFKTLISGDGIHPTENGHALINQTITNAVLSI